MICPGRSSWASPALRLALVLCSGSFFPVKAQIPVSPVMEEEVQRHVEHLKESLIRRQMADGSWPEGSYRTGLTALVVFALKHAGLPNDHPDLKMGIDYIVRNFERKVYSESLVICALELVDPKTYRDRIQAAAQYLMNCQTSSGGWSYDEGRNTHDNSNTQFAVLGLAAAERCGIEIPQTVKRQALDHWLRSKSSDGGWPYRQGGATYLSMTCAGIASLYLLGREYEKPTSKCGVYKYDTVLQKGLQAMIEQISRPRYSILGSRGNSYTLYALERVGMVLDLKEFEGLDWYRWGAARILASSGLNSISDDAFDLLFLAKGEAQIAISKWRWNGDWNNDHRDVKNWVSLGSKELDRKLDWIPARLDRTNTPAAKASLIFVNGHGPFTASDGEAQLLREFLNKRGTVVAEGCCQSKPFIDQFMKFVSSKLYPDLPVQFAPIPRGHAVCKQKYSLLPEEVSALQVKTGCHRRRILILTRDISCALEGESASAEEKERARKVSINLLQWAMRAKTPKGKLADVELSGGKVGNEGILVDEPAYDPAGASRKFHQPLGRLVHRGEWDADLAFFPTLAAALKQEEKAPLFDGEVFVNPTSEDLFACALLFITGHGNPRLDREEWLPLRIYLQNGGTIIASACCSFEEFDRGFRALIQNVLPNDVLEEISGESSPWKAPFSLKSNPVSGSAAYLERYGKKLAPLFGIRRGGRWIVIYSPVDLCCDLEGDLDEGIVAYKKATSVPIWVNLLNYVFRP